MDGTIGATARRYRYTGKERDEETGLDLMGARYYAPWLGRWTSSDPIGLGDGVNRYAYVSGNPVGMRDPSGTKGVGDQRLMELGQQQAQLLEQYAGATGEARDEIAARLEQNAVEMADVHARGADDVARRAERGSGTPLDRALAGLGNVSEEEIVLAGAEAAEGIADEPELPSYSELAVNALVLAPFEGALGILELAGPEGAETIGPIRQSIRPFAYAPEVEAQGTAVEGALTTLAGLGALGATPRTPRPGGLRTSPPTAPQPETVRVFRVEHRANQRLVAGPRGGIEIIGDKPLDLNFGQEQRALRFLRTRLKQGKSSATVKSFEVPKPFAEDVAARAVPESLAKKYPDAPLRVDISKAPDQFRLRSKKDLDALRSYLNP